MFAVAFCLVISTILTIGYSVYSVNTISEGLDDVVEQALNQTTRLTNFVQAQILAIDHNETIEGVIAAFNFTEIFAVFDIDVTSTSDVNAIIDNYDFEETVTNISLPVIEDYDYTTIVTEVVSPEVDLEVDALNTSIYDATDAKIAAFDHDGVAVSEIAAYDFTDIIEAFDFTTIVTPTATTEIESAIDDYNLVALAAMDTKIAEYDHTGVALSVISTYNYTDIFAANDDINTAADVTPIIAGYDYTDIFTANQQDMTAFVEGYDFTDKVVDEIEAYALPTNCTATSECMSGFYGSVDSSLTVLEAIDPDANTPTIVESYNYQTPANVSDTIAAYDFTSTVTTLTNALITSSFASVDSRVTALENDPTARLASSGGTPRTFTVYIPPEGTYRPGFATITAMATAGNGGTQGGIRAHYYFYYVADVYGGNAVLLDNQTFGSTVNVPVISTTSWTWNSPYVEWVLSITSAGSRLHARIEVFLYSGKAIITV